MFRKTTIRKSIIIASCAALLALLVIVAADRAVLRRTSGLVFNEIENLPPQKVALLLGTSKSLKSGNTNAYFSNRIAAAVLLYKAGKIEKFVISGDNSRPEYNEPQDMKDALMAAGVAEDDIYLDFAGFRTFDSVYRMKAIFGQEHFVIISQEFHNRRAICIAQHLGLSAVGFNAADVSAYNGFRTKLREKFARVKLFMDFAFGKKPKFLGEPVEING